MADIVRVLSSLEDALGHARADRSTLSDLNKLSNALTKFDHLSVQQFVDLCERMDVAGASPAVPTEPASTMVDDYVAKLAGVQADKAAFEALLAQMKADRLLKGSDVAEIARRYVGGTSKYSKKADAFKDIELRFEARRRAINRLDAASNIF